MSEATTNAAGIPLDPAEAVKAVKDGRIQITEDGDSTSGLKYGLFTIRVAEGDKVHYDSGGPTQPYAYVVYDNFPAIIENEGGELSDDQVNYLAEATSGEKNSKAIKSLIQTYNSVQRANAKQAEYARIVGLVKPMSEETKQKKIESTVAFFANVHGVSLETARQKLVAAGLI